MTAAAALIELQRADRVINGLSAELTRLEARMGTDPEAARRVSEAQRAVTSRAAAADAANAADAELTALRARSVRLQRRLYDGSVVNVQELMRMQTELESIGGRLAEAEARTLQHFEEVEAADADVANTAAAVAAWAVGHERALETDRARLSAAAAELADAERQRVDAAASLSPVELSLYERVRLHRTPAVVSVRGDSCGGCRLPLGIQEARSVRAGDGTVQCPSCDRILVA